MNINNCARLNVVRVLEVAEGRKVFGLWMTRHRAYASWSIDFFFDFSIVCLQDLRIVIFDFKFFIFIYCSFKSTECGRYSGHAKANEGQTKCRVACQSSCLVPRTKTRSVLGHSVHSVLASTERFFLQCSLCELHQVTRCVLPKQERCTHASSGSRSEQPCCIGHTVSVRSNTYRTMW